MKTFKRARVIIVEDQVMVAEFLASLCEELDLQVVAKARDCAEARTEIAKTAVDLMLLDIGLPDGDGLELATALLRAQPEAKILAISARVNAYTLFQIKRLGVHGFVDKINQPAGVLKAAIRDVLNGKGYFAPIVNDTAKDPRGFSKLLTQSQIEILALIGEAKTDDEIAALTGKVPSTIQSRRRDIMAKLNLHSTAKLMHYAIAQGITAPPAGKMLQSQLGTSS